MKSPFAAKMLENVPHCKPIRFEEKFPDVEVDKLTMLDRLLRFNPKSRLSAQEVTTTNTLITLSQFFSKKEIGDDYGSDKKASCS